MIYSLQTKKEKKSGGGGGGRGGDDKQPEAPIDVARLDFRVGKIVSAKKHPDAEKLYVEEVSSLVYYSFLKTLNF